MRSSDRKLLEGLRGVLRTQRCALAQLIAHLGEVEERRLHLAAAHSSMFSYCVQRLGMSEDEACRRIELARLARRFPLLFGELASGRISLSVALLLKPVLTPDNHTELIAAARGTSLRTARELLAARFPSPDVPSRIRKLPERGVAHAIPAALANVTNAASTTPVVPANVADAIPAAADDVASARPAPDGDALPTRVTSPNATAGAATAPPLISSHLPRVPAFEQRSFARVHAESRLQGLPAPSEPSHPFTRAGSPRHAQPHQRIEPLSAERYRIVFTGDASLKQKLELARDLLRHSNPSGELAPIVSRALDLLLQELLHHRFGARRKDTAHRAARPAAHTVSTASAAPAAPPHTTPYSATLQFATPAPVSPVEAATASPPAKPQSSTLPLTAPAPARQGAAPSMTAPPIAGPSVAPSLATIPTAATLAPATPSSHIARAARRAVLARDGLGCCWVDATGKRCGSTAWLQLDHHHPAGKGGSSEPENLRLLCRAHNRFAAERAYGRDHIERAIQARQQSAKRRYSSEQPASSSPAPA